MRRLWALRRLLLLGVLGALLLGGSVVGYKGYTKGMQHWLVRYVAWAQSQRKSDPPARPVHVMFLTVDHFEPGADTQRVRTWCRRYLEMTASHRDSDGLPPRHTWFYPAEQFRREQLEILSGLCRTGYGEIELHLHHSHDTSDSLRAKLEKAKRDFASVGALVTSDDPPRHVFAFVHGNMSLDNSRGSNFCGVNDEISLLKREGCFADFTFPSIERRTQPAVVNCLYYAVDDPKQPGSYLDGGPLVRVGGKGKGLLIFQGPLLIDFGNWRHIFYPALDPGDLEPGNPPTPHRVDNWIRAAVHVRGRPEWIFVKTFVHSAVRASWPNVIGANADRMYSYLESRYNDGHNYSLHYVTAREAYNIAKAAEAGKKGNPGHYRDYLIKPYRNSRPGARPQKTPAPLASAAAQH